eukprot:365609-Chlamydomonas_euryale.AAC.3
MEACVCCQVDCILRPVRKHAAVADRMLFSNTALGRCAYNWCTYKQSAVAHASDSGVTSSHHPCHLLHVEAAGVAELVPDDLHVLERSAIGHIIELKDTPKLEPPAQLWPRWRVQLHHTLVAAASAAAT